MKLEQISVKCQSLNMTFQINTEWPMKYDAPFVFEWSAESERRGESNSAGGYWTLDDCLDACLLWLEKVTCNR
jgi:hypothetical protein